MRRWAIIMLAVWLGLTVAGVTLRTGAWAKTLQPEEYSRARIMVNGTLDTLSAPTLGAVYVTGRHRILKTRWGTGVVYGAGYAAPCGAALVLVGLRRRLFSGGSGEAPADPSRRRLLVDGAASAAGLMLVGAPVYSAAIEPNTIGVRRYRVPIRGLPAALDGLRIVQLSDTHLGPRVHESHVQRAVRIALDQKPDIVALTGDYVHNGPGPIDRAAELFVPLVEAPGVVGVVGVLGNHDWYADGERMSAALAAIGVRMIDNDRVFLDASVRALRSEPPADPADALCFVGLGDLLTDTVEPDRAFAGVHADTPRVLLAHVPDTLEVATVRAPTGPRIDLSLSGHTHGGQIRAPLIGAPGVPSRYGQRYVGGLIPAGVTGTGSPAVVSRGIGMSIIPVRIGVAPEVVVVELVRM